VTQVFGGKGFRFEEMGGITGAFVQQEKMGKREANGGFWKAAIHRRFGFFKSNPKRR
jgi:hypothetical protein